MYTRSFRKASPTHVFFLNSRLKDPELRLLISKLQLNSYLQPKISCKILSAPCIVRYSNSRCKRKSKQYISIFVPCLSASCLSEVCFQRLSTKSSFIRGDIIVALATAFCLLTIKTLSGAYTKCVSGKCPTPPTSFILLFLASQILSALRYVGAFTYIFVCEHFVNTNFDLKM